MTLLGEMKTEIDRKVEEEQKCKDILKNTRKMSMDKERVIKKKRL